MLIPYDLQDKLMRELMPQNGSAGSVQQPLGELCALVDLARVDDAVRTGLLERFNGRIYPLLKDPGFEKWQDYGAVLVAPKEHDLEQQSHLFHELADYNSDVVSAWVASTLTTAELAQHLRGATFAYEEVVRQEIDWDNYGVEQKEEARYLLRYYDPLITPVLYGDAPEDWQQWFFAPVLSWWFAQPNAKGEQWYQIIGARRARAGAAPKLMLTEALKQALEHDPLPYAILDFLEKQGTARFNHDCRGVRLAQVQQRIAEARKQGFTSKGHLGEYVWLSFHYAMPQLLGHSRWAAVKREALQKQRRLIELVALYIKTETA